MELSLETHLPDGLRADQTGEGRDNNEPGRFMVQKAPKLIRLQQLEKGNLEKQRQ